MFRNLADLDQARRSCTVDYIGGLHVGFEVVDLHLSAATIEAGSRFLETEKNKEFELYKNRLAIQRIFVIGPARYSADTWWADDRGNMFSSNQRQVMTIPRRICMSVTRFVVRETDVTDLFPCKDMSETENKSGAGFVLGSSLLYETMDFKKSVGQSKKVFSPVQSDPGCKQASRGRM